MTPPPRAADAEQPAVPLFSLVIPCYDEAANLPLLIGRIEESFGTGSDVEVILVDNGSTDRTPAILSGLGAHPVIRSVRVEVNQGYGFGILAGLRAARGRFVGWTHADMQTDPADALHALPIMRAAGLQPLYVKGRRHGRPLSEVAFTVGMAVFETILLRRALWDINAQPNIMSRAFYEAVAAEAPHDWALDLYFFHAAKARGLRIVRFPVRFGPRAHGVSHWNADFSAKRRFIARTIEFSLELRARLARGRAR